MNTIARVGLCAVLVLFLAVAGETSGKSSTGWTIFRKLQSVKPQALTSTCYLPGDISGLLYNPSLAALMTGTEINLDTAAGFSDERMAGVLFGRRAPGGLGWGFGAFSYDYGTMDLNWIEGNEIKERSVAAENDYMGMATVGKAFGPRLNAGLTVKAASSRIAEEATAYAFAVDGGLSYLLGKKFMVSLVGQNIGGSTAFVDKSEPLPEAVMAGLSYFDSFGGFYTLVGAEAPYLIAESAVKPNVGVEVGRGGVGLFAGYRSYVDDAAFTYGVGLALKGYGFYYSYTPGEWIGNMHRLSVGISLGGSKDARAEAVQAYAAQAPEREKKRKEQEELRAKEKAEREARERLAEARVRYPGKALNVRLAAGTTVYPDAGFFIEDVVDARADRGDIGVVVLGTSSYRSLPVRLEGGVKNALKQYYQGILAQGDGVGKLPVILRVLAFTIEDRPQEGRHAARVKLKIEFYAREHVYVGKMLDVECFSPQRTYEGAGIRQVIEQYEADLPQLLEECVRPLLRHAWDDRKLKYNETIKIFRQDEEGGNSTTEDSDWSDE